MLWKFSVLFFLSLTCFANLEEVKPVTGVITIQNKHLNDVRKILLEDLVPRASNSVVSNLSGLLGTSAFPFESLYVNPANVDLRPNSHTARSSISSTFTLSGGSSTTAVVLASTSFESFGGPVLLHVQTVGGSFAVNTTPDPGFECVKGASTVDACSIVFMRDNTVLATLSFGMGIKFVIPASSFKIIDRPSPGVYTYKVAYLVADAGHDLNIRSDHQLLAVGL